MSTRGAHSPVLKTPTGFPLWTSKRLVVAEPEECLHDRLQRLVVARSLAGAAVDHELLGMLRDLAVEIVQQHPQRSLGLPGARVQRRSARRPNPGQIAGEGFDSGVHGREVGHAIAPIFSSAAAVTSPERIAVATCSMSQLNERSSTSLDESERTRS